MSQSRHLLEIHLAVLLFGLAGLFGKWIILPSVIIVLGRVFFASIALFLFLQWLGEPLRLRQRKDYFSLGLLGVLLAIHWITFFQSIQVSTVAVGLLTFSTFPVFTVFFEPWFFKEKLKGLDILLALVALSGVALVVPDFQLNNTMTQGSLWGIASGATFAVLSILNRKLVRSYSSIQIAFYQDLVAALVLLPFLFWLSPTIQLPDILLLILLGIVFTALSHSLFINGMKTVPARTASVIGSLEPVYGILAAAVLLQEIPTLRVILGGMIILGVAFYATVGRRGS